VLSGANSLVVTLLHPSPVTIDQDQNKPAVPRPRVS